LCGYFLPNDFKITGYWSFTIAKMYKKKFTGLIKYPILRVYLFLAMAIAIAGCSTLQKEIRSGWTTKEISPGVHLSHRYFPSLFHAPENINVINLDLADTTLKIRVAYNDSVLEQVSQFAKAGNTIAAVNGNFFNTHIGGSVCFLKVDGRIVNRTHDELNGTLFLPSLDTAALAINGRDVEIIIKPLAMRWEQKHYDFPTIISAGPLLVWNSRMVQQRKQKFNETRHCRTGIGITKDHHLVIVAVDGNAKESAGVTIPEFEQLFKALKCVSALNFDGGGSTTMWVTGEPENGVVNYPTDNKKYDHYGERKVANAILIMRR
jgi:exopolysaccharide biosynthesis protein